MAVSRLGDRPVWDDLLRSLSPGRPADKPQDDNITADDGRARARPGSGKRPVRAAAAAPAQLAIMLPLDSDLFSEGDTTVCQPSEGPLAWMAVPLDQPSDRQHAAALDQSMQDALASGADAAFRAREVRFCSVARCDAATQAAVAARMQHLADLDQLCPALKVGAGGRYSHGTSCGSVPAPAEDGAFIASSAGFALAVFMSELVAQVEGHCWERGLALACLWNSHIALTARTLGRQEEELSQLRAENIAAEAQIEHLRSEAAVTQQLRKDIGCHTQVMDSLKADLKRVREERDFLVQQLQNGQASPTTTNPAEHPDVPREEVVAAAGAL